MDNNKGYDDSNFDEWLNNYQSIKNSNNNNEDPNNDHSMHYDVNTSDYSDYDGRHPDENDNVKSRPYSGRDYFYDDEEVAEIKNSNQSDNHINTTTFGRTVDNTGYIMYGKDPYETDEFTTREMTSKSSDYRSKKPQKTVQKSATIEKKEEKRRNKIKRKKNRRIFRIVWLALVIIVGIYVGDYLSKGASDLFAMKRQSSSTAAVSISENASVPEVATILTNAGVITQPSFFKLYCKLTHITKFNLGQFNVPENMDYEEIINYLFSNNNRLDTVEIVFPEGLNILEVAKLLDENGVATYDDVLKAANSDVFDKYDSIAPISSSTDKYYKLEGYLYPDTYEFYKGEGAEDALSRLIYNGQKKTMTDELKNKLAESGMTYDQMIIIASLIQAEAGDISEMTDISAVIHNRLKDGADYDIYTLDIDATTYYPYRTAADVPSVMAGYTSNYDTKTNSGLPAGAICNPGLDAIKAALYPSSHNYYYYIHGADGKVHFASTYKEHQNNISEYGLAE